MVPLAGLNADSTFKPEDLRLHFIDPVLKLEPAGGAPPQEQVQNGDSVSVCSYPLWQVSNPNSAHRFGSQFTSNSPAPLQQEIQAWMQIDDAQFNSYFSVKSMSSILPPLVLMLLSGR